MSNPGFGLRPVGRLGGGVPRQREYYIPSTDSTVYAEGDVVMLPATGALDPSNQVQVVKAFVSGDVPLGVIVGIKPLSTLPYTIGRPASTGCYVEVCDDPDTIYEVQEDGVGGAVTAAQIGAMYNANLNITTPTLGQSGTMLTSSSATTSIADVKIIGVKRLINNQGAQTNGGILLVRLLGPVQPGSALTSTVSHN